MKKLCSFLACLLFLHSLSFAQQATSIAQDFLPSSSSLSNELQSGISPRAIPSTGSLYYFGEVMTDKSPSHAPSFSPGFGKYSTTQGNDQENAAFPRGTIVGNLGIGVGDLYWGSGYGTVAGVSPTLDIDVAVTDKLGIGNIGVGGTLAYTSSKVNNGYGNSVTFTGWLVGFRATYHFMLNSDQLKGKFDPYGGVLLGYIIASGPDNPDLYGVSNKASAFQPGIFAGAHYYFVPHFGVFAELGYDGFSIFTFGITLKSK
jgi:hypothetical protein